MLRAAVIGTLMVFILAACGGQDLAENSRAEKSPTRAPTATALPTYTPASTVVRVPDEQADIVIPLKPKSDLILDGTVGDDGFLMDYPTSWNGLYDPRASVGRLVPPGEVENVIHIDFGRHWGVINHKCGEGLEITAQEVVDCLAAYYGAYDTSVQVNEAQINGMPGFWVYISGSSLDILTLIVEVPRADGQAFTTGAFLYAVPEKFDEYRADFVKMVSTMRPSIR